MATKAQHDHGYRPVPGFLRTLREEAGLTQRELGQTLGKPQSWIYNCETGNRRVDVAEFVSWMIGTGVNPKVGFHRLLKLLRSTRNEKDL